MTVYIMGEDAEGNPAEILGDTEDLLLFGRIPEEEPEAEQADDDDTEEGRNNDT